MADLNAIADRLSSLTVIEAAELSRLLETTWGVSATASVAAPVAPVVVDVVPEQTEFSVFLTGIKPEKKIIVIKEIRAITGLGLKEAKEFTEAAGPTKMVKDSLSKDEANSLTRRLEDAGGVVSVE